MPDPADRTVTVPWADRFRVNASILRGMDYIEDGRSLLLCFARPGASLSMWRSPDEVETLARVLLAQAAAARAEMLEHAA